jgi:hypothetical protein
MQGQFLRYLEGKLEDIEQSYRWLKFGYIKGKTESRTVAAEDQAISRDSLKIKFWRKNFAVNVGYVNSY